MIHYKLKRAQAGASLVEILIGLAIGLVILTAIGTAYVNSNNTTRQREHQAQLNDPARNVLRTLQMNLMQAGYVDIFDIDAVNRAQAASLFVPGSPALVNVFVRDPAVGALTSPITQFFPGLTPIFGCDGAMASSPSALFAAAPPFNACGAASATRHTLQVAYQATANNAANASNSLFAANANTGE